MDIVTLLMLALVAASGVTYDVYRNPQTLTVQIVTPGKLEPSLDKAFITMVVCEELDRIARLHSLLAHPAIKSTDEKDLTETIADSIGGADLMSAISAHIAEAPNSLKFAMFNEESKLTMYVSGHSRLADFGDDRFDLVLRLQPGESPIDLMKRSAIQAAAHIDPYVAMLYLIERGNATGRPTAFDDALRIAERVDAKAPSGHSMLLARLTNLKGIVALGRGDYQAARAAFAIARTRVPEGEIGPTMVLSTENQAFADLGLGKFQAAATTLDALLKATDNMETLVGDVAISTEGVGFTLERSDVNRMLVTALQLRAAAAMGLRDYAQADSFLEKALKLEPNRVTARWLRANLADLRGDRVAGDRQRAEILQVRGSASPFLENATAWSTLYFSKDQVVVLPGLYGPGPLPQIPPV